MVAEPRPPLAARPFEADRDRLAARRIWREVGWLRGDDTRAMDAYVDAGRALVAEVEGQAECLVLSMPGALRYLDADLPWACVTGVTTSHVARGQGLATRLTARLVAQDAAAGAVVSGLGMFDQGFYNRLGFGSGGYGRRVAFDPAALRVPRLRRAPRRWTRDDGAILHAARLTRFRGHGGVTLTPAAQTIENALSHGDGFGLGFADGDRPTHGLWLSADDVYNGPYNVRFCFWRDHAEFIELLSVLASLADQVKSVRIAEPAGIQLQDLLDQPVRRAVIAQGTRFVSDIQCGARWQMRLNDLPAALAASHLPGPQVRFNLELSDPIADGLPPEQPWRGVAGAYRLTLGPQSAAEPGRDERLPTLTATVNAFTRLWLGVRPATGLAVTDALSGPPALLAALDIALRLPEPLPDWSF
jgi:GNAT superfamily N-acetyltransferase